jgi:uncharacterized protein
MSLDRRQLFRRGGATGAGLVAASVGVGGAARAAGRSVSERRSGPRLFPPLVDGDLLALPPGFSYRVVAQAGVTTMVDGTPTPDHPDGLRALVWGRGYRLIQNHEARPGSVQPVPLTPGTIYDEGVIGGGCTIIDVTRQGERVSEWVGLSGTLNNCSGGATPWGSWLSCEETELTAGSVVGTSTLQQHHGYVFEVFANDPSEQSPQPIRAWGRAPHETVVLEPSRSRAYLTEDASTPNGLLYRWSAPTGYRLGPHIADSLGADAGTLEALALLAPDGSVLPDLSYVTSAQIGRPFTARWKTIPDRHATTTSLRSQLDNIAITRGKKLEGAWGTDRGMYFTSSFAAAADVPANATPHDGQLWWYDFRNQTLTLVAYFPYNALLHQAPAGWEQSLGVSIDLAFDGPDNVHISPYGSLILAEDGATANHTLAWSPRYGAQAIVRNRIIRAQNPAGGNVYGEMTGPYFSPDGRILFVSVQVPGYTFAISGPWPRYL